MMSISSTIIILGVAGNKDFPPVAVTIDMTRQDTLTTPYHHTDYILASHSTQMGESRKF